MREAPSLLEAYSLGGGDSQETPPSGSLLMETICPFLTFPKTHHLTHHWHLGALEFDLFTKNSIFSVSLEMGFRNRIVELKDLPLISTTIQVDKSANFSECQHRNITFKKCEFGKRQT